MRFRYVREVPTGTGICYDYERGEEYYDTYEDETEYEASDNKIIDALFWLYADNCKTLEEAVYEVVYQSIPTNKMQEFLDDAESNSIEEVIEKSKQELLSKNKPIDKYTLTAEVVQDFDWLLDLDESNKEAVKDYLEDDVEWD